MKLNPNDIRHQEFKRSLRGLNPAEVHAFLEVVSEDYDELMGEVQMLRQKLRNTEQQLDEMRARLKQSEDTAGMLQSEVEKNRALLDAQMDAALLTQKAEAEAASIVGAARKKADELTKDIRFLEEQRNKVAVFLRDYLKSQMALLGIVDATPALQNEPAVTVQQLAEDETKSVVVEPVRHEVEKIPADLVGTDDESLESSDIDAFLNDVQLDDIPEELADALKRYEDENEDERKKRILEDLENLSKQATGMFRKSDFTKMLGDDVNMKSEEMINKIYAALEKKKSPGKEKP